jgi:hypothetical protein
MAEDHSKKLSAGNAGARPAICAILKRATQPEVSFVHPAASIDQLIQ